LWGPFRRPGRAAAAESSPVAWFSSLWAAPASAVTGILALVWVQWRSARGPCQPRPSPGETREQAQARGYRQAPHQEEEGQGKGTRRPLAAV